MRILSGIQANGRPHIGHYYGAIRQFIDLEKHGEPFYFIADLHALTTVQDAKLLREHTRDIALAYLACGLDPSRSTLFCQSEVPQHAELFWILGSLVPLSNLERAHSYKDKIAKGVKPNFGLFAYPVLMAADILLYGADRVPVGKDQVQHIEFARDWAIKFNLAFVPGYDAADPDGVKTGAPGVLKIPEAFLKDEVATLPGVDGQKMSKSYGNAIDLFAEDAVIKKRIMSIKTDSTVVEAPKPLESPLYALLKALTPPAEFVAIDESWRSGGKGYGEYKLKLVEQFHAAFDSIRQKHAELARDPGEIDRVLSQGAERARQVAAELMGRVRRAVGFRV